MQFTGNWRRIHQGVERFIQVLNAKLDLQEITKRMEERYQGELVVLLNLRDGSLVPHLRGLEGKGLGKKLDTVDDLRRNLRVPIRLPLQPGHMTCQPQEQGPLPAIQI